MVNEDGVNFLIILGVFRYDFGIYKCVVKNKVGENIFIVIFKVMGKFIVFMFYDYNVEL